jgi:hypothetical protein
MTNCLCCPRCRIRFSASASYLTACPECCLPLHTATAESLVGLRLFDPLDVADVLPAAREVSLPLPNREPS